MPLSTSNETKTVFFQNLTKIWHLEMIEGFIWAKHFWSKLFLKLLIFSWKNVLIIFWKLILRITVRWALQHVINNYIKDKICVSNSLLQLKKEISCKDSAGILLAKSDPEPLGKKAGAAKKNKRLPSPDYSIKLLLLIFIFMKFVCRN